MSGVRGPTSALTDFLREKNIHVPNTNRFRRRGEAAQAQGDIQAAVAAELQESLASGSSTGIASGSSEAIADNINAHLADAGSQARVASGSGSSSNAATASSPGSKRKATSVSSRMGKKSKAKKGLSMNFDEEEDDEEDFQATASDTATEDEEVAVPTGTRSQPAPLVDANKWQKIKQGLVEGISHKATTSGTVDHCPGCEKRFTITQYTVHTASGGLCHRCIPIYNAEMARGASDPRDRTSTKAETSTAGSGADSSMGSAVPAPRKRAPVKKKKAPAPQDRKVLPNLQAMCINIISEYIEDVEALGGIAQQSIDALSKSICKSRRLNGQTLQLFLEPDIETLSLYDCSKLDGNALSTIAVFSPRLHSINLQLCGQINNGALDAWSEKLDDLQNVELYGPFLVRVEAWHRFFERLGDRLQRFKIRESPRFDLSCVQHMVAHCPNLVELGLAQIGPLNGPALKPLHRLKKLTYLDISDPGVSAPGVPPESLKDDDVIELLAHIGSQLDTLNIGGNADLTDRVVLEGILPHCKHLRSLYLTNCNLIEGDALTILFDSFAARGLPALTKIDLGRCLLVNDAALVALADHSGDNLVDLNINSCNALSADALKYLVSPRVTAASTDDDEEGEETTDQAKQQPAPGHDQTGVVVCPSLQRLDVSFVRRVDDDVLTTLVSNCRSLKRISVFGDNKISDDLITTSTGTSMGAKVVGLERVPLIIKNVG